MFHETPSIDEDRNRVTPFEPHGIRREEFHTLANDSSMKDLIFELPDHYRPRQHAALWLIPPDGWREQLAMAVDRGVGNRSPSIFFRADDIGAGGRAFELLCLLFRHFNIPLALAVVPAWLSAVRRNQLFEIAPLEEGLWGWHQHGWRHVNWQRVGKKSEFGEQRPFEKQWRDIWQGQQKMKDIFGSHLMPVFTPPWNRLSNATLKIIQELGFRGVSMAGPFPRGYRTPVGLKNLRVQLDLHTRKAKEGPSDYAHLLEEITALLARKEPQGIMIHHHRMTAFAFEFLHTFLALLKERTGCRFMGFQEILEGNED